jgi:hypothetical protein
MKTPLNKSENGTRAIIIISEPSALMDRLQLVYKSKCKIQYAILYLPAVAVHMV